MQTNVATMFGGKKYKLSTYRCKPIHIVPTTNHRHPKFQTKHIKYFDAKKKQHIYTHTKHIECLRLVLYLYLYSYKFNFVHL